MATPTMVVLHLDTGHVLAAAAIDGATPTVDDLTGGTHLAVRAKLDRTVTVPAELLTVLATGRDLDVLATPTSYRVVDAVPPLSRVGPPAAAVEPVGAAGRQCLSVWQVGTTVEVVREQLDGTGRLPTGSVPPGATHRIVACPGLPLLHTP